jgi:RES domain-containing protein
MGGVAVRRIRWRSTARVVPSRFPPVDLFERVADAADRDAVIAVESLTNERLRDESGELRRVAEADRVSGPGASYVMAPFTHVSPAGGRFSDAGAGAYYAARRHETAIRETVYHRERFLAATAEPPIDLEMRVIEADIDGRFHDIRAHRDELPGLYASDDYSLSQSWARRLRAEGSNGVAYASVRHEGGECVAVFKPRLVKRARQAKHLLYRWDGTRISEVFELTLRLRDEPGRVHGEG